MHCHGRRGCSAVTTLTDYGYPVVLSCGRLHGEIRRWSVQAGGCVSLLSIIPNSSALTWIDRFCVMLDGSHYAFGFRSNDFKAYLLNAKRWTINDGTRKSLECFAGPSVFQVDCNGGNRPWDCWIPSPQNTSSNKPRTAVRSSPLFASLHRKSVLLQTLCRPVPNHHSDSYHIRSSLHGRDINCCLIFGASRASPGPDSCPTGGAYFSITKDEREPRVEELLFYCFAGGEDTYLSSWILMANGSHTVVLPDHSFEHHRGHISNIRCMTYPVSRSNESDFRSPGSTFLLTGGGRGQLGLWSVHMVPPGPDEVWRPGWLGSIKLRVNPRSTSSLPNDTVSVPCAVPVSNGNYSDLRIMAVSCIEPAFGSERCLIVFAACSDGSIRIVLIWPPSESHPITPTFLEIGLFSELTRDNSWEPVMEACYLDVKLLNWSDVWALVVSTNTAGFVECWSIGWNFSPQNSLSWSTSRIWVLGPNNTSFGTVSSPALNCIESLRWVTDDDNFQLIVVGGDDGSVRIARVLEADAGTIQPCWVSSAVHHYAAVVQVSAVDAGIAKNSTSLCIISLASDQRLILWRLTFAGVEVSLYPVHRLLLAGLGDPHGLSVSNRLVNNSSKAHSDYILLTGTGTLFLKVSE